MAGETTLNHCVLDHIAYQGTIVLALTLSFLVLEFFLCYGKHNPRGVYFVDNKFWFAASLETSKSYGKSPTELYMVYFLSVWRDMQT